MYSGAGFSDWEIGDVDVFIDDDGTYHLFHLIIPNHDYIAHAMSKDGISWERQKNALFVGHPGEWDDDMLWTMHVSRAEEGYEMYYTGLQLKDRGKVQKVGRATSKDLMNWEKDASQLLESAAPHYEDLANNPREWLSFRDPFKIICDKGETFLLMCARYAMGPVSRRGCVGVAKLTNGQFELEKPLFIPHVYDDVECPCVIKVKGMHYLIGSIREDIKVRYWFAPEFQDEYHAFHDNVLLPQGNYAARIIKDSNDHILVYNFYFLGGSVNTHRSLPPPKELDVDDKGRLQLKSFYRWQQMVELVITQDKFPIPKQLFGNRTADFVTKDDRWLFSSLSGYELFAFQKPSKNLIWEGVLTMEGLGKCGLILDADENGDGYFISLDFVNGFAQIRAWGFNPDNNQHNFVFDSLQNNQFEHPLDHSLHFKLIRYGSYIELSLDGIVILTLVDYTYSSNNIGFYASSSIISLKDAVIYQLPDAEDEYALPEVS